ncbi:MAG: tetratricopeptide repeat protein [Bdellovibrionaceae bacterium]|nr:tetratricopeptide repeat protein [Pseudobdellovibrionaceae bacterium]
MQLSDDVIEKYKEILRKDPRSRVFAPLADALRQKGLLLEAEKIALEGARQHPEFAGGLVVYARILKELGKIKGAVELLKAAVKLAPDNILAHLLLGELSLATKDRKLALSCFKMVLFYNPRHERALQVVKRLESITADEYDEDAFALAHLSAIPKAFSPSPAPSPSPPPQTQAGPTQRAVERVISLVDAFLVRNDITRARNLLNEARDEYGPHPEILRRLQLLQGKKSAQLAQPSPVPERTVPLLSREERARQLKLETLRALLRKIEKVRREPETSV